MRSLMGLLAMSFTSLLMLGAFPGVSHAQAVPDRTAANELSKPDLKDTVVNAEVSTNSIPATTVYWRGRHGHGRYWHGRYWHRPYYRSYYYRPYYYRSYVYRWPRCWWNGCRWVCPPKRAIIY